jgi:hypothetical protein
MPFQPGTMDDAPEAPELDDSPGNKRILLILGALAGLAVLAIAAYFLLFAGGSEDKAGDAVVPPSVVQPSTAPSTAPKTAVQPKISARNFGTDPFKALLSDGSASTTTGSTTTTTGTTTTGTTTPVTTPPVTTPPVTTPPVTTPAAATYRFKVINVASGNEHARVSLNGDEQTVGPGDIVGGKFKALRFQGGKCGTFKFGDEPAFDLCEGSPAVRR